MNGTDTCLFYFVPQTATFGTTRSKPSRSAVSVNIRRSMSQTTSFSIAACRVACVLDSPPGAQCARRNMTLTGNYPEKGLTIATAKPRGLLIEVGPRQRERDGRQGPQRARLERAPAGGGRGATEPSV